MVKSACLLSSIILNLLFIINIYVGGQWKLSWSSRAAAEAEAVAAISCSGHGRAYLDGLVVDGNEPVCECNTCFQALTALSLYLTAQQMLIGNLSTTDHVRTQEVFPVF